jgi:hypothetical protein
LEEEENDVEAKNEATKRIPKRKKTELEQMG